MSGVLDHSPAYILHTWMKNDGGVFVKSWTNRGFVNNDPGDTLPYIVTSDVIGDLQGREHVTGVTTEFFGIQLRIRGGQQESYVHMKHIQRTLEGVSRELFTLELKQYIIHAITLTSPVVRVGKEQPGDNRFIYSLNCKASITNNT